MTVGIVVVSHSARIAEGIAELCAQVAPRVVVVPAGGTAGGGLGTDAGAVLAAAERADGGDGVVLVGDLGSAILTAETVVELGDAGDRWRVVDGPVVEGTVAAAVTADGGASLDDVAQRALGGAAPDAVDPLPQPAQAEAVVVLRDPQGLHARPAAALVRLAARFDAEVRVNGADARSLLQVLALGLGPGATARITATGPDASDAVSSVRELLESEPDPA